MAKLSQNYDDIMKELKHQGTLLKENNFLLKEVLQVKGKPTTEPVRLRPAPASTTEELEALSQNEDMVSAMLHLTIY